jgi:hypothetical protein
MKKNAGYIRYRCSIWWNIPHDTWMASIWCIINILYVLIQISEMEHKHYNQVLPDLASTIFGINVMYPNNT